ncbi:uracil-DNA glycosylase [Aestuariivirga litoralis]|uniref:uracil-DNA glycosylase n=1 Tax=Aestuariivirga litoralis TaxID=2650924 RepID=UPI001FE0E111|nr:uracil-DNA glycosylase [Aestuariivirga litoralis]
MPISDPKPHEPGRDCPLCPRLVQYRHEQRKLHPDWFNAPVPTFGSDDARLLIAGLAPGVAGANRTGRPFTGDFAGELLYGTLIHFGFAKGEFKADPKDGLTLKDTMIANAVRCVPPQNKPLPVEIRTCNGFLRARIDALPKLTAIVALGRIAHDGVLTALGARKSAHPFSHGGEHQLGEVRLFDSYHCSRYNTNTGVLTPEMFRVVFGRVRAYLDSV